MYKPSDFKERISFIVSTLISDGQGGTEPGEPETILTTNAKVTPLTSSRKLEANQQALNQVYEVVIWKREGFEPTKSMTLVYRGRTMTINSVVDEFEKHWYHVMKCTDGQGAN